MRIWMTVRVLPAHGVGGGMERLTLGLATGLAGSGHDVRLVSTAHPAGVAEEVIDRRVRVHYVPGTTWRRYQKRWWSASYDLLRSEHDAAPYDVVFSHSAAALGYLREASTDLGIAGVVLLHGSARGELRTAWRGARGARGLYRLARLGWRLPRQVAAWRRVAPAVDRWLAISANVATDARRELGLADGSVAVVPPGIDIRRFRPDAEARAASRAELGIRPEAPVLVLATRLEREKGVDVAVTAATQVLSHHPDLRVLIAGAGHEERHLRRVAAKAGLESVCTFLGLLDHDRLPAVLAAGDLFLLPSRCDEGAPLSLTEASAAGLPVIASRSDGAAAAVADGVTGLLVRRGEPRALAAAVLHLLADENVRRSMGERARAEAVGRASDTAMVEMVERTLVDAVAAREAARLPR